jgi:NADPH-dependent 2,4-dienoyl-CoA reductase/sulfur reductase-like enzyme/ferredoxin
MSKSFFLAGNQVVFVANADGADLRYRAHADTIPPQVQVPARTKERSETVFVVEHGTLEFMVGGAVGHIATGSFVRVPLGMGFCYRIAATTLPSWAKSAAYLVSTLVFFFVVTLRHVVFNTEPEALLSLMSVALGLAFMGGVVFKGRSGWCGTLCPLAPIQKAYGQAPVVLVKNGYCPTCVGCQKNCYDFNPRAAMHSDLSDADPWYSGHRELFVAGLPGLAIGFYTATPPALDALLPYFLYMGACMAITLGLFMAFTRIFKVSRYKAGLFFSMGALLIFYWFASPIVTASITQYTGIPLPGPLAYVFFVVAIVAASRITEVGLFAEKLFRKLNAPSDVAVGVEVGALRAAGAYASAGDLVVDQGVDRSFAANPKRSLLEGMESAGIKIDYGCRLGMCGADPVAIIDGHDALSEPSSTERDTLARLGLEGRARMACVCRATRGGVVIDSRIDPRTLPAPAPKEPEVDQGEVANVHRVVIIGNGAAGMTAADEIRRLSPSCEIDIVAREKEHFYNRMAIGRLLYGRTAMSGMALMPADWHDKKRIGLWLNTEATAIDRAAHEVALGTGERLGYDRLVLAQGGAAAMPEFPGNDLPGCFVLREADGAMQIRQWRQQQAATHAVVIGGGVLGIEAADALLRLNLAVTIIHRGPRLMDRQLDEKGSAILRTYLEGLGMTVRTGAKTKRCVGTSRVSGVELDDGTILAADIVVVCAGVQPNIEIARDAGLAVNRGVIVDRNMRTSDPLIFAAGDVAELPGAVSGLWAVSTAQARVAALSLFGKDASYTDPNTTVSLKMDGIDVKGFGRTAPEGPHQELLVDLAAPSDEHRMLVLEAGTIAGAVFVGPPGTATIAGELIDRRPDLTPVLARLKAGDWSALSDVVGA